MVITNSLKIFFSFLNTGQKKKLSLVIVNLIIQSILEMFGISMVIPVLMIILDPEKIQYSFLSILGFNKKEFIPYNQEILDNLTNKHPLYLYVPLNKVIFSQSKVYKKLSDGENISDYSKRIKQHYKNTNQVSFLNHKIPKAIYLKEMNKFQLKDNRRIVAAIKAFYPNVEYTNEIPGKFYIPLIIHHPNEELSKEKIVDCFKKKSECRKYGKTGSPSTYLEYIIWRSLNSYDDYFPFKITNRIPIISKVKPNNN